MPDGVARRRQREEEQGRGPQQQHSSRAATAAKYARDTDGTQCRRRSAQALTALVLLAHARTKQPGCSPALQHSRTFQTLNACSQIYTHLPRAVVCGMLGTQVKSYVGLTTTIMSNKANRAINLSFNATSPISHLQSGTHAGNISMRQSDHVPVRHHMT